jgi:hypothetical protein
VSDPYVVPDWQRWQVNATEGWPVPVAEPTISWRSETVVAVIVAAYSALLGGAVGIAWSAYAPKIYLPRPAAHSRLVAAINGSEAAAKVLLGDDMWLALLGILAGLVSVAVLFLVARDSGGGPGGVIGLAVGGVLGSIVAAQLGHHLQQPHVVATLRSSFPGITHHSVTEILSLFTFELRTKAALLAWPITAIVLHAASVLLRYLRSSRSVDAARL